MERERLRLEEEKKQKEEEARKRELAGKLQLDADAQRKLLVKRYIYEALNVIDDAEQRLTVRGAFGMADVALDQAPPAADKFLWQPISEPEKKTVDESGKEEELTPSRVTTSNYLVQYLQEEYDPNGDQIKQFGAIYDVLLTEFSAERTQSAPYPDYQDPVTKESYLLICAEKGYLNVLELLNEVWPGRMDVTQVDRDGHSALFLAAQHGHYGVVKYLVEEMNHPYTRHKDTLWTPLHVAASMGHWPIVHYLIHDWHAGKYKYHCKKQHKLWVFYDMNSELSPSIYEVTTIMQCKLNTNLSFNLSFFTYHCYFIIFYFQFLIFTLSFLIYLLYH